MEKQYKFSDQVIARIAQIVQEGMLLGIDVVDLFRQVRVKEEVVDNVSSGELVMTEEYVRQVKAMHDRLLEDAEHLKSERDEQTNQDKPSFLVKD